MAYDSVLFKRLEALYHTFDLSMLSPDPLEVVRRFSEPADQETAGLIAADWELAALLRFDFPAGE